jgi:hypothetical protein
MAAPLGVRCSAVIFGGHKGASGASYGCFVQYATYSQVTFVTSVSDLCNGYTAFTAILAPQQREMMQPKRLSVRPLLSSWTRPLHRSISSDEMRSQTTSLVLPTR